MKIIRRIRNAVKRKLKVKERQLFYHGIMRMLKTKDCGSDILFISFVSFSKFLYISVA